MSRLLCGYYFYINDFKVSLSFYRSVPIKNWRVNTTRQSITLQKATNANFMMWINVNLHCCFEQSLIYWKICLDFRTFTVSGKDGVASGGKDSWGLNEFKNCHPWHLSIIFKIISLRNCIISKRHTLFTFEVRLEQMIKNNFVWWMWENIFNSP